MIIRTLSICFVTTSLLSVAGCGDSESQSTEPDAIDTSPECSPLETADDSWIVGTWRQETLSNTYQIAFMDDGSYRQETFLTGEISPMQTTEGNYTTDNGVLARTTATSRLETPFFANGALFAWEQVFLRTDAGDCIPGMWSYQKKEYLTGASGNLELDKVRTDIVVLHEDGTAELSSQTIKQATSLPVPGTPDYHQQGTYVIDGDEVTVQSEQSLRAFRWVGGRMYDLAPAWLYDKAY